MKDPDPEPITVEVPVIRIETCSLRFPDGQRWIFNLTKARELVRLHDRRELYSCSTSELVELLDGRSLDRGLVDEADINIPGIGAVLPYGGQRRLNLIDGVERAARAYMLDQSYPIYVLSDLERDLCLWSKTGIEGIKDQLEKGNWPGGGPTCMP